MKVYKDYRCGAHVSMANRTFSIRLNYLYIDVKPIRVMSNDEPAAHPTAEQSSHRPMLTWVSEWIEDIISSQSKTP